MLNIPKIQFSKWIEISKRNKLKEFNSKGTAGVYIVSIKKNSYKSNYPAKILDKDIIYIGMSTASVRSRVDKFNSRIRGTNASHSGGKRIFSLFHKYPTSKKWKNRKLFVAVSCRFRPINKLINFKDFIIKGKITYIEYFLFARFFKRFQRLPIRNKVRLT